MGNHLCKQCEQSPVEPGKSIKPILQMLQAGGGVVTAPDAESNQEFLKNLDETFPELLIYKQGRIQTSPGVEEIENSPTEYYRTVGAVVALLACYSTAGGEDFGLEAVSAGQRGPMSMDKVPGKFINIGNKKDDYLMFCKKFADTMESEDDWWAMLVFLIVHDVGKSDGFRKVVNDTLPKELQSDDHDRALAFALGSPALTQKLLPTIHKLSAARQEQIRAGFATNFQLPQLGQGEIACINFQGLLNMDRKYLSNGGLLHYFYHSIFDIAGAGCNEKFIYPIALVPVYMGFTAAMEDLIQCMVRQPDIADRTLYFKFLCINFEKSYPDFAKTFQSMCHSEVFRHETGLAVLRVLALTRNTYKNPENVLELLLDELSQLVQELAGSPVGPQVMLYYAPDCLRMGLGEDMTDESGENMKAALQALTLLYKAARRTLILAKCGDYQYQLNVAPVVSVIKKAGKEWKGGKQLLETVQGVKVKNNDLNTEGIVELC